MHYLKPCLKTLLYLLLFTGLTTTTTQAQQHRTSYDILVYFMPDSVDLPPGIQNTAKYERFKNTVKKDR